MDIPRPEECVSRTHPEIVLATKKSALSEISSAQFLDLSEIDSRDHTLVDLILQLLNLKLISNLGKKLKIIKVSPSIEENGVRIEYQLIDIANPQLSLEAFFRGRNKTWQLYSEFYNQKMSN